MCIPSRYTKGRTNTADAIRYARETSFTPQNGMRSNAVHIAIIVTDGKIMYCNNDLFSPQTRMHKFIDCKHYPCHKVINHQTGKSTSTCFKQIKYNL